MSLEKSFSKENQIVCKSSTYDGANSENCLFDLDCTLNKELINDFYLSDHYMLEKSALKRQSTENTPIDKKYIQFNDWNDGLCEW